MYRELQFVNFLFIHFLSSHFPGNNYQTPLLTRATISMPVLAFIRLTGKLLWLPAMLIPLHKISCTHSLGSRGGEERGSELKQLFTLPPLTLAVLSLLSVAEPCLCRWGHTLIHPCMSQLQKTLYFHGC